MVEVKIEYKESTKEGVGASSAWREWEKLHKKEIMIDWA